MMVISLISKGLVAIALIAAIVISASARAPRRAVPADDLRRLMASALALYVVGAIAMLAGKLTLAVIGFGFGVAVSALAAWLSRGQDDRDEPPRGQPPLDRPPPPDPDGLPELDWDRFERERREWSRPAPREPAGR